LKEINLKARDCEDRLKDLGTTLPTTTKEKIQLLWSSVTQFTENFKNALSGRFDPKLESVIEMDASGAAQIKAMFAELYGNYVENDYKATEDYSDRDIEKAIIMHEGDSIPGFPSIDAFLYLLQPQLEKLKEPATGLLMFVYTFMEDIALRILTKLFTRFPQILESMTEIVIKAMQVHREKARKVVEQAIEAECNYLYTTDRDYLVNGGSFMKPTQADPRDPRARQQQMQHTVQDANKMLGNELRNRIDAYFAIVCRNARDSVPKLIGAFLVRACQHDLQFTLYDAINQHDELLHLLSEPESITKERDSVKKTLETLQKAAKAIKKDPDLSKRLGVEDEEEVKPERGSDKKGADPNVGAKGGARK